jgi:hypothetical protein
MLVAVLSSATAVWLLGQLAAGVLMKVQTWPVAGFPMFSEKRSSAFERRLEVRTRSGREVTVGPADFGLTELQLLNYQRTILGDDGAIRPQATDRLARLAAAWNRGHPGDPAVRMTISNVVRPLRPGAPPEPPRLLRWTAP